jgi:hypothetical protein
MIEPGRPLPQLPDRRCVIRGRRRAAAAAAAASPSLLSLPPPPRLLLPPPHSLLLLLALQLAPAPVTLPPPLLPPPPLPLLLCLVLFLLALPLLLLLPLPLLAPQQIIPRHRRQCACLLHLPRHRVHLRLQARLVGGAARHRCHLRLGRLPLPPPALPLRGLNARLGVIATGTTEGATRGGLVTPPRRPKILGVPPCPLLRAVRPRGPPEMPREGGGGGGWRGGVDHSGAQV